MRAPLHLLRHPAGPASPVFGGRHRMQTPTAVATNAAAANPPGRNPLMGAPAMKDNT